MTTLELCKYLQKRANDIKNTHPISANLILAGVCEIEILADRLEKIEKNHWHDLRANPNDLPDDSHPIRNYWVVIENKDGERIYCVSDYYGRGEFPEGRWEANRYEFDVIAWREIEPYEGMQNDR